MHWLLFLSLCNTDIWSACAPLKLLLRLLLDSAVGLILLCCLAFACRMASTVACASASGFHMRRIWHAVNAATSGYIQPVISLLLKLSR